MRHYKTLTWNDRLQIEAWLRVDTPIKVIAEQLGVHISTVYREIKRGQYEHLNSDWTTETRYSPEISEQKKQDNLRAKGGFLKLAMMLSMPIILSTRYVLKSMHPAPFSVR